MDLPTHPALPLPPGHLLPRPAHRAQRSRPAAGVWPACATLAWSALAGTGLTGCDEPQRPDAPYTEVADGSPLRGKQLMAQYQCASCHVIPGVPGHHGGMGPTLASFGRRSYIAGNAPNTPATLQHWLLDPQAVVPGTPMPAMGMSADDARDMAAYLLSLR